MTREEDWERAKINQPPRTSPPDGAAMLLFGFVIAVLVGGGVWEFFTDWFGGVWQAVVDLFTK